MKKILLFTLFSICFTTISIAQCGYTVAVSTPDAFLCNPAPVQLNASTTGVVPPNATGSWTPTTGLNNPNIPNPIATPNVTTTYTYTVSNPLTNNLFINGDFELGNTGFTTGHTPGTGGTFGLLSLNGTYAITTSPSLVHNNFVSCADHTPTGVNMLVLNCSSTPNTTAWCQTVTVNPNTDYVFSMWAMSTVASSPAQFFVEVNGTAVSTAVTIPSTTCQWQEITFSWNSGSLTSADFCIMNQNLAQSGNDAAIDDISLIELCSASDDVTITVNNIPSTPLSASVCAGDSLFIGGAFRTQAGFYNDTLTAFNGCDSILTTQLSLTSYSSTATILICAGDSAFLQNAWQTQDGFYQDVLQSVVDGCDSIITTELNLITFFGTNDITICEGDSIFLQNSWQTQAGFYLDTLTSINGCDSIVTTQLDLLPTTPPNLGNDVIICPGDSVTFSSNLTNVSFEWQDGSTNNSFTAMATGDYILTTITSSGCRSSDTVSVSIATPPTITFSEDTVLCNGELLEITVTSNVPVTYLWQDNSTNNSIETQFSGTFSVTVTDDNGCTNNASINVIEGQIPFVFLGNDTTICVQDQVILNAANGNNGTYVWQDGSTGSTFTAVDAGTYAVTVTENTCFASDEVTISEESCDCVVAFPNAFSPNGDGQNETIFPIIEEGCEFTSFQFRVFNRWGQMVYESTSATPNNAGWDGTINGELQAQDTYVWTMTYKSTADAEPVIKKGDLFLMN